MKLDKFINRPVLSTVISILIVILGVIGLATLPVTQYPDIAPPTVSVRASYTGANAQTVLNSVVAPLEDQINGVENMMYIQSSASNNGSADISIYFNQGTDPDMAAVNVQNRVSMAQGLLPAEVTKVGVTTQKRQNSMLLIFSLYDAEDKYNIEFIENYAKINLIPEIQRVKGVGDANVMGMDYSMRIWLKPDVMAQYNLVPSDISGVLAEQNIEAAPGQFGERGNQTFQYTIRYKGRLQQTEEFEDIVIKALPNGEVLRLGDVARIELGRLAYTFNNTVNGHKAVTCIVFQMAGTNATETINNLLDVISKAEESLPAGLKINVAQNANDFLYASIHEVIKTLIEAFILVFIVVYVFLQDMRSTLIPAIAIPVALIATFFVLKLIGFSVNLLTLSAMVLAIAIVVDDAIVVVEGVHAKLDQGYKSSREASIDAMSELGGALVSITLVMMSVFIPVSFMGGTAGTFYRQFGITMAISIAFSALNALTLSPALCAIFLKPHDSEHKPKKMSMVDRFHASFNAAYDSLLKSYKKRVVFFIHKKWLSMGLVAASIVLLMFFMKITPTGMVPNEDTGTIMGAVTLPPGTSQERAMEVLAKVDSLVAAEPAVESRTIISGYSFIGGQGPSYGSVIIKLKDWEERSMMQNSDIIYATLFMRAQKVIKDAQVLFFAPPMIPGYSVSSDIELNMQDKTGGSLDHFFEVVNNYRTALEARPEINSARTTFNPSFPQYQLDIDAAACKKAGISPSDILSTMQGYFGGLYASNFNSFGKMYRVMIQADPVFRLDETSLDNAFVRMSNGEMAPLSQFVTLTRSYGAESLSRFNMFNSIAVNAMPAEGYSTGDAIRAVQETAEIALPKGYGYDFGGITREESQQSGTTVIIFGICILMIYLILSALYESFLIPFAVILAVPAGLMGSFLFARIAGLENNIYLQTGLIMLIGLLAKTAILLTEYAAERRKAGMGLIASAVSAAKARFRPILMTVLTMIFGLFPLVVATGVGANGNRSLGTGVVGGMFIGTLALLFIVPVLFISFQWLQERLRPAQSVPTSDWQIEEEMKVSRKEIEESH